MFVGDATYSPRTEGPESSARVETRREEGLEKLDLHPAKSHQVEMERRPRPLRRGGRRPPAARAKRRETNAGNTANGPKTQVSAKESKIGVTSAGEPATRPSRNLAVIHY